MRKLLSALILLMAIGHLHAQGDPHYSMFMFNKLSKNPAYAGSQESLNVSGHYRNQWSGIVGAPRTYTFAAHSPFMKDKVGVGLAVVADKIGIVNTTFIDLAYAYRIKLNETTKLAIGVQGQLDFARINWGEVDALDLGDARVGLGPEKKMHPNFGFGAYLQNESYYLSVSVPRVLKTTIYEKDQQVETANINSLRSYYFMGGLTKRLNKNIKFQPNVLVSFNPNVPFELALNTNFIFLDVLWLGTSYRLGDSFNFIAKYQLTPQLRFAAAVDVTLTELTQYSPGSWEVMMEYRLLKKDGKYNNIRYF